MNNYFKKFLKFSFLILVLIGLAQTVALFDSQQNEMKNQLGLGMFKTRVVLAQFFFPRYPARLKYVIGELNQASDQLVYYNSELRKLTSNCDCQNAQSQCGQETRSCNIVTPRVFGEACPDRKEMQKVQIEIQNKNDQISFLRELLQKEMESGLREELETLREEEAIQLESALNDILVSSQNIIAPANANLDILNDDDGQYAVERQCRASCEQGIFYNFEACVGAMGEHSPIEMLLEVGAGLKKLDLGKIGINKIGFNLSDKIELGKAGLVKDFKIPLPSLNIRIPDLDIKAPQKWQDLSLDSIIFHPPSPEIPTFPWANFSCPTIDAKPYQCFGEGETDDFYANLEWYLQTFSWLAEKCQEIPTMKGEFGAPKEDKMEECLDKENVHLTIIQECDEIWEQYFACLLAKIFTLGAAECPLPTGVCWNIKHPSKRGEAIVEQCSSLFREIKEPTPSPCNLEVLKDKCDELREQKKEEVPQPCKFVPIFTGTIEEPPSQYFQGTSTACSPQTISNTSLTGIRLDCPISAPALSASTPKIKLPDIIIPDIRLPSFNFSPFLKVKLPNFIFEDIIFPELKFCNMDDCGALLPPLNLEIPYPILRIPDIEIPPFYASIPGIPGLPEFEAPKIPLKIEMDKIKFPPIPIPLPEFDLTKNIILNYDVPKIAFPKPEIIVNFKGVKIDAVNILLGLISSIFSIPGGCISGGFTSIPLVISFPDYHFSWPRFPEFPDLCNNEYNNMGSFCQDIRGILNNEVVNRVAEFQNIINEAIQNNVQNRLDQIAGAYEQLVREAIIQRLDEIKNRVEEKLAEVLKTGRVENGLLKFSPVNIPLDDIIIPMESINALLNRIPNQIPISWPKELKEIELSEPVGFQLPSIPLDNLSYKKEIKLKLPGFQLPSFSFSVDFLGNYPSCEGQTPSGNNPYPVDRINVNLGEIIGFDKNIYEESTNVFAVFGGGEIITRKYEETSEYETSKTTPETPTATPYITVLSPNGGEELKPGETYSVQWVNNHPSSAKITISLRDERYDPNLFAEGEMTITKTSNTGTYKWKVPEKLGEIALNGSYYKVAIYINEGGEGKYDESNSYFSISSLYCEKVYGNGPIGIEFIAKTGEVPYDFGPDGTGKKKCQSNWETESQSWFSQVDKYKNLLNDFPPLNAQTFTIYRSNIPNQTSCPNVSETVYLVNCEGFRSYATGYRSHEIYLGSFYDTDILAHELGHSFAGLCDEYEEVGFSPYENCLNCCKSCSKKECHLDWPNVCYEGCNLQSTGWFRDAENDIMRTASGGFGSVDTSVINNLLGK